MTLEQIKKTKLQVITVLVLQSFHLHLSGLAVNQQIVVGGKREEVYGGRRAVTRKSTTEGREDGLHKLMVNAWQHSAVIGEMELTKIRLC